MSHQSDLISEDILAYLKQHENKELMRFLTCGNVDDGKSTLIGRLLYDSKQIFQDQLEAIEEASRRRGTDYVDLCGEPAWMRQMIDAHDDAAKASGAFEFTPSLFPCTTRSPATSF